MVSLWGLCVSVCLWGFSPCVHIFFLCLTLSLWSPVWSTSWQTPTCHIYCPAEASRPDLHQQSHQGKSSENQRLAVKNTLNKCENKNILYVRACLCTSIVWSISCAAMVDATATAMADDTANCPGPPRGSAVRSSGRDRKSGGAIGWTHSTGNAPERLNTEPNFQPDMHTRSRGITTTNHTKASTPGGLCALKQLSPLLWVLITICLCSNSRSAFHLNKSVPYLHAFLSHLQDLALPVAALITWHLIQLLI